MKQKSASHYSTAFQRALQFHQQGMLVEAERLYKRILLTQRRHFGALQQLGVLRYQQGRISEARDYFGAALRSNPTDAATLSNFALAQAALGRLEEAVTSYDKALAVGPGLAEAHNNRGNALLNLGRFEEALTSYDAALVIKPDFVEAHYNRGNALLKLGRSEAALASYDEAIAIRPDYAEAHYNRGNALNGLGRPEQAMISYDAALAIRPDHAEAHCNRGNALLRLKRLEEAVSSYDRALEIRPDFIEALNNRGNALIDLGRIEQALLSFAKALALQPDNAEALNNRGNAFLKLGRPEQALISYDAALAIKPDSAEAHCNRGNALQDLERPSEALASYDAALAIRADYSDACEGRGAVLRQLGRLNEASRAIDKAITFDPTNTRLYHLLTLSERLTPDDRRLRAMEALARDLPARSVDDQKYLHFALAKTYADIGDQERSFRSVLEGNRLKRTQTAYDEAVTLAFIEGMQAAFDEELMRRGDGSGEPSPVPVFILGMPRSGSTLIEQILAGHPKVFAAGEIDDFRGVVGEIFGARGTGSPSPEILARSSSEQLRWLGASYLNCIRHRAPTDERVTNKMPDNFRFAGLIHLALPNARIIHTRRNPVDTCFSCFSTHFFGYQPYSYDLAELGRYYRGYAALMAHWRSVLPAETMLEVQYEDVVADLEGQARRIIAHCGLEWDARCLDFHKTERPVLTASAAQVRSPIYKSSVGRWRAYEAFLGPLLAELEPLIARGPD